MYLVCSLLCSCGVFYHVLQPLHVWQKGCCTLLTAMACGNWQSPRFKHQ